MSDDPFEARIQQVQVAANGLRHLQDERRETLAFISHDIRAPLASALMQIDSLPAPQTRLREPISQALTLGEDFLRTSRAEMMGAARFEELDMTAMLHQAIDDAFAAARAKSVQLVRQLPDDPVWVQGEFGLLHRAMLNLVLNAVQYAPAHSSVEVSLAIEGGQAVASVTDHGPGIPASDQARLFQRFLNDVPAGANRRLLTDVLRGEWGFGGFVVSDAMAVGNLELQHLVRDGRDAAFRGLAAGLDMDMASGRYPQHLASLVRDGQLTEGQVDVAVRPILAVKVRLGLFERPYVDEARAAAVLADPEHRKEARLAARRSMVLLRNEGKALPLSRSLTNVAVIGPLGGWTGDGTLIRERNAWERFFVERLPERFLIKPRGSSPSPSAARFCAPT